MVLDIGCGRNKVRGEHVVGLDLNRESSADVIADFDRGLPFRDSVFDRVFLLNALEHSRDPVLLMREVWRVSKPGALVKVTAPHYSSRYAWGDLTHVRPFSLDSAADIERLGFRLLKRKLIYITAHGKLKRLALQAVLFAPHLLALLLPKIFERFLCYLFGGVDCVEFLFQVLK